MIIAKEENKKEMEARIRDIASKIYNALILEMNNLKEKDLLRLTRYVVIDLNNQLHCGAETGPLSSAVHENFTGTKNVTGKNCVVSIKWETSKLEVTLDRSTI